MVRCLSRGVHKQVVSATCGTGNGSNHSSYFYIVLVRGQDHLSTIMFSFSKGLRVSSINFHFINISALYAPESRIGKAESFVIHSGLPERFPL